MMLSNGKVAKMPDKLTDNEIVKALKQCSDCNAELRNSCNGCLLLNYFPHCTENGIDLGVDLINRLQAENEQKDRAFENLIEVARLWKEKYNNAKKELFDKTEQLKTAKAEAYKECIEKVKEIDLYQFIEEYYQNAELRYEVRRDWFDKHIDNLLKELVGEDNAQN